MSFADFFHPIYILYKFSLKFALRCMSLRVTYQNNPFAHDTWLKLLICDLWLLLFFSGQSAHRQARVGNAKQGHESDTKNAHVVLYPFQFQFKALDMIMLKYVEHRP